jgi:hypothetical protein
MLNKAQQQFGAPSPQIEAKIKSFMDPIVQEFISSSPFVVMATSNADGDCDASPKGGKPGFVKVLDERTLLLPDLAGNNLFQSYENIETNPRVGLIVMIPGCGLTVRVNGRVSVVNKDQLESEGVKAEVVTIDEQTSLVQALKIEIDQVYPHCPRAFHFSGLWDVETINANRETKGDPYWFQQWAKSAQ